MTTEEQKTVSDKTPSRPGSRWHDPNKVRKVPRYTQVEAQGFKHHEQPGWRNGARVRK